MDGRGEYLEQEFTIDGRSNLEEEQWWNPEERRKNRRPGPGILAPLLAEKLHDSNHSLFSVHITSQPAVTSQTDPATSDSPPPSETEICASVPHPKAYYCPKHNGWVVLSWSWLSPLPLAQSYVSGLNHSLPDPIRRRRTPSCIEEAGQPFGNANRTHHFHRYEGAVNGHELTPPLKDDEAEVLDLYVCCQCSLYSVVSQVISGVVSKRFMDKLQRERKAHPPIGRSPEQGIALTIETIITAIENRLFRGNSRNISVTSPGFQAKVGWNPTIKRIFELFGFEEAAVNAEATLKPPSINPSTRRGKQNRCKLLRAWIEFGSWVSEFKRANAQHFRVGEYKEYKLHVQLDSVQEMYEMAIGAHPDQIPRGGLSDSIATRDLDLSWKMLGLTSSTYSSELLGFAYLAQCRCDPGNTPAYFTHFTNIVVALHGSCPPLLQELVTSETSRNRFTLGDVPIAATSLGFGIDNVLRVEYGDDVPDDFVENAWKDCLKHSWRDHDSERGADTYRVAKESFRILAEYRGSVQLKAIWENASNRTMNPQKAYDTLEVPRNVEDYMLITLYNTRLDNMREAILCIAEARDSETLRQFISSGTDHDPRFANHNLHGQKPTGSILPATLHKGPKMNIDTFCAVYSLPNNVLQLFHENAITGTHAFPHITETDLTRMGFKIGEVIDLKEAIKMWAPTYK